MWFWWTKTNQNPSILGRLSVIKWKNWSWWESYPNTGISDETQFAVVVWLQWVEPCLCYSQCGLFIFQLFNIAWKKSVEHGHTLQTNPLLREEETHSTNSPMTLKAILSSNRSHPQRDDYKIRNDTKYYTTKQGPNTKFKQTKGATIIINQQHHTHHLRALSRIYWGLKLILLAKSSPWIMLLSKPKKTTTKNGKLAWRLLYLSNISSWGNNQIITVMIKDNDSELTDCQS